MYYTSIMNRYQSRNRCCEPNDVVNADGGTFADFLKGNFRSLMLSKFAQNHIRPIGSIAHKSFIEGGKTKNKLRED